MDIEFAYTPRPWQREVLAQLDRRRFSVIVAHRRAGKTEAVCLRLLMAAMNMEREHPAPFFAYVAPFLNQAKAVAWDRLKYYARPLLAIPGVKINESETSLTLWGGQTIRIFGADYPDRLRGLGFDGVVMDEVAQMRPDTWPAVVRPALADRGGWAAFIGTPKGQNAFFDLYSRALADDGSGGWSASLFTADKTNVLSAEELAAARSEMSDMLYRQEFLCDFTADNINNFIDFFDVQAAVNSAPQLVNLAPVVIGVDPARFGDDKTAMVVRRGRDVTVAETWAKTDLMWTSSRVSEAINRFKPRMVFVDSVGLGAGVVDRLRQLGHRVVGVNSGNKPARPDKYVNLKAEMWAKMREWLQDGAHIPNDARLRSDLLAPLYDYDHAGRLRIEGKDDLKKRGLPSPDLADALALTFAQPVAAAENKIETKAENNFSLWR